MITTLKANRKTSDLHFKVTAHKTISIIIIIIIMMMIIIMIIIMYIV